MARVVDVERDLAHKEAKDAQEWCHTVEAGLKALQAAQASQLQEREEKMKAQEAAVVSRDAELKQVAWEQAMEHDRLKRLKEEEKAA